MDNVIGLARIAVGGEKAPLYHLSWVRAESAPVRSERTVSPRPSGVPARALYVRI